MLSGIRSDVEHWAALVVVTMVDDMANPSTGIEAGLPASMPYWPSVQALKGVLPALCPVIPVIKCRSLVWWAWLEIQSVRFDR